MRGSDLPTFLRLDAPAAEPVVAVLPVPYERTTSWGRGTENGPEALLLASHYVELYDEELEVEPCRIGIETLPPVDVDGSDESVLQRMSAAAETTLRKGRFLAAVGGEHTVTPALVRGALDAGVPDLGVVQFDAHADLRQTYRGTPWNHACAMSRVLDLGLPTLAVGIRSLTRPEAARIAKERLPIIWAEQLDALPRPELEALFDGLLASLPDTVYLTFDLDFFDPSVLPATGTPGARRRHLVPGAGAAAAAVRAQAGDRDGRRRTGADPGQRRQRLHRRQAALQVHRLPLPAAARRDRSA